MRLILIPILFFSFRNSPSSAEEIFNPRANGTPPKPSPCPNPPRASQREGAEAIIHAAKPMASRHFC